jgi:rhamnose utilization protein RhaD (predicted bifunctional aldolase and dehydrogenase)
MNKESKPITHETLLSLNASPYVFQYSVVGSVNPDTRIVYKNGPVIARCNKSAYAGFVTQREC